MNRFFGKENKKWICLMTIIMMLQFVVASYFCMQKQGFHYDEYYSYYSSNVTYGLVPTDREWKDVDEIRSEFRVLEGEGFRYGLVKTMQSFDVHPPLYYMVLHTVCSLFPGVFSKWFGLGINLFFFVICYWMMAKIAWHIFKGNKQMTMISCLLFGFQVGVLSGITFIRMYMMLTMLCLAITIWHIPVWSNGIKLNVKNALVLFGLVLAGFLTHYYFAVFLFFLAAYTCLYNWWVRRDLKASVVYGSVVCAGMAAAVLLYPACLSHIFRGYRGTEATGAFFDFSNTILRVDFFTDLMNQSVFGGALWFFLLVAMLLWITLYKKNRNKNSLKDFWKDNQGIAHIGFVTLGYFFVVAKTALLNAEEANRYELPIYGFCMLLMIAAIYYPLKTLLAALQGENEDKNKVEKGKKARRSLVTTLVGIALVFQFAALGQGKVQFLYEQDADNVQWAAQHKDKAIVYLYNPNNVWMIWDESEELMQYDKIYFVSLADESAITDSAILESDEIYVYASRMEAAESIMESLIDDNLEVEKKEKIRELLYCDLYYLH